MAGRKPKAEHKKLSVRVPFNCTKSQLEAYDHVASALDMERAEWIRSVLDEAVDYWISVQDAKLSDPAETAEEPPADPGKAP